MDHSVGNGEQVGWDDDPPELLGHEPQWWLVIPLRGGQTCLIVSDVVARDRDYSLTFGHLDLEHHHAFLSESHFGRREIKLPHPAETFIIKTSNALAAAKPSAMVQMTLLRGITDAPT